MSYSTKCVHFPDLGERATPSEEAVRAATQPNLTLPLLGWKAKAPRVNSELQVPWDYRTALGNTTLHLHFKNEGFCERRNL
jgi:hypothetical protein